MEAFLFENDVDGMRARELRNLLIQKLGVDPSLIGRIIDRDELKRMVNAIVYEKYRAQVRQDYLQLSYKAGAVVAILLVLYFLRNFIWGCLISVTEMIGESSYKSSKKFKLLMYNVKRRKLIGALALTVSLILELAVTWMKLAVMLSWVLSRDHFLRRFMLPTLSFPVSANTLVSAATGKSAATAQSGTEPSIGGTLGSYNMDLGPMMTIAALNFLIGKLDNLAASIVLEHKRNKEERHNKRFYAAHPGPTGAEAHHQGATGADAGDSTGGDPRDRHRGEDTASSSGLLRKRASASKTDAESIEDSVSAFFGRSRGRSVKGAPSELSHPGGRSETTPDPSRGNTVREAGRTDPADTGLSGFEDYEVVEAVEEDSVPDLLHQADSAGTGRDGGESGIRAVDGSDEASGGGSGNSDAGARWTID